MIPSYVKYFAFGHSEDNILLIGTAGSIKDFYQELYKKSSLCQDPKAHIFMVTKEKFNSLKTNSEIIVI